MNKIGCNKWVAEHGDSQVGHVCGKTKVDETMVGGDKYIWLCKECYNLKEHDRT